MEQIGPEATGNGGQEGSLEGLPPVQEAAVTLQATTGSSCFPPLGKGSRSF